MSEHILSKRRSCRDDTDGFGFCECACHDDASESLVLSEADELCLALNRARREAADAGRTVELFHGVGAENATKDGRAWASGRLREETQRLRKAEARRDELLGALSCP